MRSSRQLSVSNGHNTLICERPPAGSGRCFRLSVSNGHNVLMSEPTSPARPEPPVVRFRRILRVDVRVDVAGSGRCFPLSVSNGHNVLTPKRTSPARAEVFRCPFQTDTTH